MLRALVASIVICVFAGCALSIGERHKTPHLFKTYIINITIAEGKSEQKEISADSITESNGCILFWRGNTIDTVLCEHMARVIVTERN